MKSFVALVLCSVLVFAGWTAFDANAQTTNAVAQKHVAAAKAVAFRPLHDFSETFDTMCRPPEASGAAATRVGPPPPKVEAVNRRNRGNAWYVDPVKVFDNLSYIGSDFFDNQAAWAITGSDGIILIDTGYDYTAPELIGNGLKRIGRDPSEIRYVLLSHAHGDRYHGATYIQKNFPNARIAMSEKDWEMTALSNEPDNLKPKKDMVVTDGMKLSVGDSSVTVYITPGHTWGTLSYLVTLKDGTRSHMGYLVGGRGWTVNRYGTQYYANENEAMNVWMSSLTRFYNIAEKAGADVYLTIHPQHDNFFNKATALRFRGPRDPHPFVSKDAIKNHYTLMSECLKAQLAWQGSGTN